MADERDRALLVELATGTLRWLGTIDHLIARTAKRPLARVDPEVRDVLRLGIYQLLHLDRVPASAVVDDAVQMTRKAGKSSAAGFVNAVLRHVSRTRAALPLPARPALGEDGAPRTGTPPSTICPLPCHTHGGSSPAGWTRTASGPRKRGRSSTISPLR